MIEVIEHINEPVNIFREFKRILKKGGCEKVYGLVLARTAAY